jgi:hypothetical protein
MRNLAARIARTKGTGTWGLQKTTDTLYVANFGPGPVRIQDYRCENREKRRVKRRHRCHLIGQDSLFQKILIITPKKQTVHPGDAFEDTAIKPGFEIVKF